MIVKMNMKNSLFATTHVHTDTNIQFEHTIFCMIYSLSCIIILRYKISRQKKMNRENNVYTKNVYFQNCTDTYKVDLTIFFFSLTFFP